MPETATQKRARVRREKTEPDATGTQPGPGGQLGGDSSPEDAATRGGRKRVAGTPPGPDKPTVRAGSLEAKLGEFFAAFALVFSVAGDEHCAGIIARGAEPMAEAWSNLAAQSPAVKRVLLSLISGSAWGGVIVTTASVAVPIMQHHNMIPAQIPFLKAQPPGDTPPSGPFAVPNVPGGESPNGSSNAGSPVTPSRHSSPPAA